MVIDSDVVPYPDWLSDLIQPLRDPNVGVSTGVRWFTSQSTEVGTLVRYLWNVGSVPEMSAFQSPFGGSCAYRRDVLERGLAERWSQCLFDDCVVPAVLKQLGLEVRIAPRVILANCESITLGRCFEYLRRQMLNALCYNPWSHWILAGCFCITASVFGAVGVIAAAVLVSDMAAGAIAACGLAGFVAGMSGCLIALEMKLRPILRQSGQDVPALSMRICFVGGMAVSMYAIATICACFARRVSWRGLDYKRVGFDRFILEDHRPFSVEPIHPLKERASV